jgi:hypothetical protein
MAAKSKPKESQDAPNELAAPAVLRRLQMDAHKFSAQIDDAEARLAALGELSPNAAETKDNREQIARIECELVSARDNFGKTAKILLAYDRSVDDSKRDASEKMSRDDVIKFVKMHAIYSRQGTENLANRFAGTVRECKDNAEVHKLTYELFRDCNLAAIDSAVRETHLPVWCRDAIESVL